MHQTNLAAINAARKQFGADYKEFAQIEKIALREFSVQINQRGGLVLNIMGEARCSLPEAIAALKKAEAKAACADAWKLALGTEREGEFVFPMASDQKPADTSAAQAFFASLPKPSESQAESDAYDEYELQREAEKADAIANSQASEQKVAGKLYVRLSSIPKPTKKVWYIADQMILDAAQAGLPRPTRAQIQDRCVELGIATGTARTQYQAWKKANDATLANMEAAAKASERFNSK